MMKIYHSNEHTLQVQCVYWFRITYRDSLIFAIPNGGKRHIGTAIKMKKEGVLSGIPDLMIAEPYNSYNGLFIELKNGKKGKVTDNQRVIIDKLRVRGYRVEIARSFEEFKDIVINYFNCKETKSRGKNGL